MKDVNLLTGTLSTILMRSVPGTMSIFAVAVKIFNRRAAKLAISIKKTSIVKVLPCGV